MQFKTQEIRFDPAHDAAVTWLEVMKKAQGLRGKVDLQGSESSSVDAWTLGPITIIRAEMAALELSPAGERADALRGECVYFKLVTAGHVIVEQNGRAHRFGAGRMLALDAAQEFTESVPEQASVITLRIPKRLLHERGWKPSPEGLMVPDMHGPDAAAVGELIQCIANQSSMPSAEMRNLLGGLLLDLVEFVLAAAKDLPTRRCAEEIIFRAKNYIRQNFGQEGLDASSVGAAVNISGKHLQRLFRSQGTSLMRHVWQVRLEHADALLRAGASGTTSVQEIAWQCGFSTAAHFSRVFKQRFGVSPGSVIGVAATPTH